MGGSQKLRRNIPNIIFLFLLFLGVAGGLVMDAVIAGTLIGLGAGLIIMAVLRFAMVKKKETTADQKPIENS